MNSRTMTLIIIFLFLTISQSRTSEKSTTACLQFKNGSCISCPYDYHSLKNQCYKNIQACLNYTLDTFNLQKCSHCDPTLSNPDQKGRCTLTVSSEDLEDRPNIRRSTKDQQLRFYAMSLSQAHSNPFFKIANSFMLNNSYKTYISPTTHPILYIGVLGFRDQERLKIIYYGNGASLLLTIFSKNLINNTIQVIAMIRILPQNLINFCAQYSTSSKCLNCQTGYHLQNQICYSNINGCISYYQNICLECAGLQLLVQNRCLSNCCTNSDLSQLTFYGNHHVSANQTLINHKY